MYFPQGHFVRIAIRDAQIWREFTGDNLSELARRYRLTSRRIRDILDRQRVIHQRIAH
jgi:Mor family transcriptional regulator